jgi:excisionase family DNA binding protein
MTTMIDNGLMKPAEVCHLLAVSRTWVYDAASDGRIPSIRLGGPDGPLRFLRADLEVWLEEQRATWTPGRG